MAPVASTSTLPSTDDFDIDRILNQEASLLSREQEVLRVLAAFKLNPYEILELDWMPSAKITDTDIRESPPLPCVADGPSRPCVPQEVPPDPPRQAQASPRYRGL